MIRYIKAADDSGFYSTGSIKYFFPGFPACWRIQVPDMPPGMYDPPRQVGPPAKRVPVLRQVSAQCVFKTKGAVEVGGHVGGVMVAKLKMFGGLQIQ